MMFGEIPLILIFSHKGGEGKEREPLPYGICSAFSFASGTTPLTQPRAL
jgi:hypothetical protein